MFPELIELPGSHLLEVRQLLKSAGLPFDDVGEPGRLFYRLELAGTPVGWAGLESYGPDALLRPVVVLTRCEAGRTDGCLSPRSLHRLGLWALSVSGS